MRVNDDYSESWNVAEESKDTESVLNFWTKALAVRKKSDVLVSRIRPVFLWLFLILANRYTATSSYILLNILSCSRILEVSTEIRSSCL